MSTVTNWSSKRGATISSGSQYFSMLMEMSESFSPMALPSIQIESSKTDGIDFSKRETEFLCLIPPLDASDTTIYSSDGHDWRLHTLAYETIPSAQKAIVTPTVKEYLNTQEAHIPIAAPRPGEVVVRIAWTGLCRSVSTT